MSTQTPVACDLTAINPDELNDHNLNGEQVFAAVEEIREISNGYAFRLPSKTNLIEKAGAFIARERLCCSFFHFTLEVVPDQGPVWLKLTGDKNIKKFIEENIVAD